MRAAVVTTTINAPTCLAAYMENAARCGHKDTLFVVTGDRKTPHADWKEYMQQHSTTHGVEGVYLNVEDQESFLQGFPALHKDLPWNCIQRRNVSLLYAYVQGADVVITIDDDNFFVDDTDFVGEHIALLGNDTAAATKRAGVPTLQSSTGWLNVCETLQARNLVHDGVLFYARGYPMKQRQVPVEVKELPSGAETKRVVINAGLWLDDPDIDAGTRMFNPVEVTAYKRDKPFLLAKDTYSPINSQNTAIAREAMVAYFVSWRVGRYDDIWPGYVVERIAKHLDHAVSFGFPLVKQERNEHNLFNDYDLEKMGLLLTDEFMHWLQAHRFAGSTYADCFAEVITLLRNKAAEADDASSLPQDAVAYIRGFADTMDTWAETMRQADVATKSASASTSHN